jgi:hypothetical protein
MYSAACLELTSWITVKPVCRLSIRTNILTVKITNLFEIGKGVSCKTIYSKCLLQITSEKKFFQIDANDR